MLYLLKPSDMQRKLVQGQSSVAPKEPKLVQRRDVKATPEPSRYGACWHTFSQTKH